MNSSSNQNSATERTYEFPVAFEGSIEPVKVPVAYRLVLASGRAGLDAALYREAKHPGSCFFCQW